MYSKIVNNDNDFKKAGCDNMAKTIPIIISNSEILVYDKAAGEFKEFKLPGINNEPNIPFYHAFAKKIAESQHYFKEFVKSIYSGRLTKNILAIIVPDDTSTLESIFINEFFLNSGTCKAVAQITMAQTLSKEISAYISISKTNRNVALSYIKGNEIAASKFYDLDKYDPVVIMEDAKRLHIDIEYESAPVFINNFSLDMDDFFDYGIVTSPKQFMDKIANVDVEKI